MSDITRRDFIKGAGCAAIGLAAGMPVLAEEAAETEVKSRVVLIRHADVITSEGGFNETIVGEMIDQAVSALFEVEDASNAWKRIVTPDDTVGIKSNEWRYLPTPPEVERVLAARLESVGVPAERIAIDDRGVREHQVFQKATALINTRPMRTHAWSGVGSLIKNYIMFSDHPPDYHDNACAPLAKLWDLPQVKGKTRLNVLVMLTPQFHNVGPHHFDPSYVWNYHGLIVSRDPVAADSVGLRIIQAKRREVFGEDRPLQPVAHHIALAETDYGLGKADPQKIELVRLGWTENSLI